jgi:hypothetical protein
MILDTIMCSHCNLEDMITPIPHAVILRRGVVDQLKPLGGCSISNGAKTI